VLAKKNKHGLPNHRLGHFIVARLFWAAGKTRRVIKLKKLV